MNCLEKWRRVCCTAGNTGVTVTLRPGGEGTGALLRKMATARSVRRGGISCLSPSPLRKSGLTVFRRLFSCLLLFALLTFSQGLSPGTVQVWRRGREQGGMPIFLLLAWATASSHRRSSGELESRPLGKREVEATRGCGEEPGSRQGGEEAMGQELKGAL